MVPNGSVLAIPLSPESVLDIVDVAHTATRFNSAFASSLRRPNIARRWPATLLDIRYGVSVFFEGGFATRKSGPDNYGGDR